MIQRRYAIVMMFGLLGLFGWTVEAHAELVMKVLVVNPSETETKQFDIRSPLPPEVKPEHVLNTDGLKVDYDSQAGVYMLVGSVTLKPKESITKRIVLEDVWVISPDRFTMMRKEVKNITDKLTGTMYAQQGQVMAEAITRRLQEVEESQTQPFLSPSQHITQYREDAKRLQMIESDLVSLRQLMVMAALNPPLQSPTLLGADEPAKDTTRHDGQLSILATWRLIFIILGLLGFVSLSFFLVWQRQLKMQLAKQLVQEAKHADSAPTLNGNGQHAANGDVAAALQRLPRADLSQSRGGQSKTP